MRALYISHNGMLEGLGSSQVLPYLRGLARRGVEFDLLSYELPDASAVDIATLRDRLAAERVRWTPLRRARDTRLVVKVTESLRGVGEALRAALARRPEIVHGRSYLPTAVGDVIASVVPRAKLVFDCRGMIGDEYVDSGHWTPDRLEYRALKRYESRAFHRAEGVVVLTRALRQWVEARQWLGHGTQIETIPCCVDLDVFRFDADARAAVRAELGLEGARTLVYAGSLGSWYEEPEMARFSVLFRELAQAQAGGGPVRFLLLTRSDPTPLVACLRAAGFGEADIVVRSARPAEMSRYLSAGDVGLSFIKSWFSKKGSSPTKVAEYLACGLPVVLNGDIGDQAELAAEAESCVVLGSYADAELAAAAARALRIADQPLEQRIAAARRTAERYFGLEEVGVARYERLYQAVLSSARIAGKSSS
jgi:glycosyltransferase involved in cell wall biosynthesis